VQGRLVEEIHDEDSDEQYLTATINEIMRRRPGAAQRRAPPGQAADRDRRRQLSARSDPDRQTPTCSTTTRDLSRSLRLPPRAVPRESRAGGHLGHTHGLPSEAAGARCLGASFALLEMKLVLRAVLQRCELHPAGERPEVARRRGITISPSRGAQVILRGVPARGTSA